MFPTYSPIRGISLLTLVALSMQIVMPIIENTYANNTTYYVDVSTGNDGNDGMSEGAPWQTITRVNSGGFLPGDQILFKCGENWNEQLIIRDSGILGSPITFGSYGSNCDGTNDPAISYTGGAQIAELGTVSHVSIQDFNLSGGDTIGGTIEFSSNGSNIAILNSLISNPSGKCIDFTQSTNITISGNEFTNCAQGIEIGDGTATVSGNNFHTMGSLGAAITMNFLSTGVRTISDNMFTSLGNGAVKFGQNSTIEHNIINNSCIDSSDCAAITNMTQDITDFDLSISGAVNANFITTVGTGINFDTYHQDGIRLDNLSRGVQVIGNTISSAQRAIAIKNGRFHTISGNTLYNPRTYAIHVMEDETSGSGEVVESNTISNNTILTYNPDYSMVRIEDAVNNIGTLATLSGNKFLNVYKSKLPVAEIIKTGGSSIQVDKDQLSLVDGTASNFTYFGYKVYTSTGVYSGSNLITNGAFGSNITGWSTDVLTLTHNAGSGTLRATQGTESTGTLSSNTFSIVTNRVYEVSGWMQNITNSEGHATKIRLGNSTGVSYIDRDLDIVSTSTGTTFKAYVKANSTAADARLDFIVSNPSTATEFDNIVVREVAGLTYNSRSNEAVLVSNTGASVANKSCPGLPFCTQYSDYSNNPVSWPIAIGGYSSQIVFWNEATQILRRPTGTFVPSSGTAPNGTSVTLTWSASNSLSQRLAGDTYTGAFDYVVAASGAMTLIPPPDGTNTYTFSATNDIGTMVYTADVVTQNTPPTNDPAFATGSEDTLSITGIVTASDVNSGGVISYQSFDAPLHGVLIDFQSDGTYDYRPNPDFCGVDTFTFLASDAWGLKDAMNPGVVTISVLCTNDIPVAIDDTLSGTGGVTGLLDVILNDTDPDTPYAGATAQGGTPQIFTITGLTQPANGIASVSGSYIEYTPDLAYYGPDSFTYMIQDQSGATSNIATIGITVAPGMNLPPEVSGMSTNINEDTAVGDFLSGSDINGDMLTFSASILPNHGTLSIVGSGFTYTPDANYYGSDSFIFFANDGTVDSSGATINITINPVEDLPIITNDTVNVEIQTPTLIDIMANDLDPDNLTPTPPNQGLSITGYTLPTNGTLSVVGNQFQYTGNLGYLGPDTFDYSVIDANGNISNTGTVNITVSTTNQFPLADSGSFTTNEDTVLVQTLSGSDPDLTPVTFVLDTNVSNGTLTLSSTGEFVYTPNTNYYGSDSFTFHVTDGVLASGMKTVTLDVLPINDMPTANNDTATGTEDSNTLFDPLTNDTDVDVGDVLSLHAIVTQPTHGFATQSGNVIDYAPVSNYCGPDSLMYQTIDSSGSVSNVASMIINVVCTNDGPTVSDSSYSVMGNIPTNSGNTLTASLTGVDIDGDILTYIIDTGVTNGILSVSSTGYMNYTPNLGFSGTDSFTYSVDDGNISAGSATVTITVDPNSVNLSPIANDNSFIINEDGSLINSVTGTDPESDPLTYILDSNVSHGTLSFQSSGSFSYNPTSNYYGSDVFTFYINDGLNNSATGTITITINSINDVPVANNDSVNGTEDLQLTISPLANDTDADVGDTLSLSGYANGIHGSVTNSGASLLIYTPNANYCGSDSIPYSVQDQSGALSNTGTITVNIACVNDVPVANDDILGDNGIEDASVTIPVLMNDTDTEDGTPLSIANLTQPSNGGTVGIVGTNIVFSPTTNYCGSTPITFTYQARDSAGALSNVVNVTIPAVDCINDVPTVQSATYTMTGNVVISSGTIDGSGNLTGYSETSNILYSPIIGTDVEGSILSFTLATLPLSGTATVMSTGALSYKPPINFVGSISFTVTGNDGTADSLPATINICVVSPDPKIARPSCAPSIYVPAPTPNVGPGGGGGGGSPTIGTIISNYQTAVSNGTSNELTSQLYLNQRSLSPRTGSGGINTSIPSSTTSTLSTSLDSTIQNLLGTISTVVETAKITSLSSADGSKVMRNAGRTILSRIISSTFSSEEQLERINSTAEQINIMEIDTTTLRETLTLKYLLRIFYVKRAKLLMEIEFFNNILN